MVFSLCTSVKKYIEYSLQVVLKLWPTAHVFGGLLYRFRGPTPRDYYLGSVRWCSYWYLKNNDSDAY